MYSTTARQSCSALHKGIHAMLNLDNEILTTSREYETAKTRSSSINHAIIQEYATTDGSYSSLDISLHDVKLETFKTSTQTIKLENGERFKVKTLSFERADGVTHEVKLFGERY